MPDSAPSTARSSADALVLRSFEASSELTQRYELARALAGVEDPPYGFVQVLAQAVEQGLKATLGRTYPSSSTELMTLDRSSEYVLRNQVEDQLQLPPGSTRELIAALLVDELKYALARGEQLTFTDSVTVLTDGLLRMRPARARGAGESAAGKASEST